MWSTLVILSKMLQRRQAEEVSGAGLEGLVKCPFCHYCAVMENPEDKVLICRNPDCGRESCRLCKESNHVPLRCDEVEKTEGTRKEIEEKLTEARIRECWKCSKKFFKEEGCNKMTCTCGAKMCYICKAKGVDYDHFYGQGGEATAKRTCPLWSDNKAIHEEELAKAAEEARQKLEQDKITFDIDPLKGIAKPAVQQSIEEVREKLFQRWYSLKAQGPLGAQPGGWLGPILPPLPLPLLRVQDQGRHQEQERHQKQGRHQDQRQHHHQDQ